jgi:hypothetical protein
MKWKNKKNKKKQNYFLFGVSKKFTSFFWGGRRGGALSYLPLPYLGRTFKQSWRVRGLL